MKRHISFLVLELILFFQISAQAQSSFQFEQISTIEGLPNSMIHCVVQDNKGFMWVGTFHGLYRYDGFEFMPYKSDMNNPALLPSNNVICLAPTKDNQLWIGTHEGICCLDQPTGNLHNYVLDQGRSKRINDIFVSSRGEVFVASNGLFRYDAALDSMMICDTLTYGTVAPGFDNIQAVAELSDGDLLIVSWKNGFYRFCHKEQRFIHYPDIDGEASLMSVFQDSSGAIWIGSYTSGLYRITFSSDKRGFVSQGYRHEANNPHSLHNDCIYAINEHTPTHTLWVGSREGFSIMDMANEGVFDNYSKDSDTHYQRCSEIQYITRDSRNTMWISTKGDGIICANNLGTRIENLFQNRNDQLVQGILMDDEDQWVSYGYGVGYRHASDEEKIIFPQRRTYSLSKRKSTGTILLSVHDEGLVECSKGRIIHQYQKSNCGFVPHDVIFMSEEDAQGNLWVASLKGIGVRYADGREYRLGKQENLPAAVGSETTALLIDLDGTIWCATQSNGVLHITGDMQHPEQMSCTVYDPQNGLLPINTATCLLQDRRGRIWVGTDGCGLCEYDASADSFVSVHSEYNLPGDMVGSMQEDRFGNLWIGTNHGLARLSTWGENQGRVRIFTTEEGLPDNYFELTASCQKDDVLYFGSSRGVVAFRPSDEMQTVPSHHVALTAVYIDGRSLESLSSEERVRYADTAPAYISQLTLPAQVKNFTLHFASLTYNVAHQAAYSYRLVGYDTAWHQTQASVRSASYTNLDDGEYTFEVKATDENGNWCEPLQISIRVLPPFYRTWWAYTLYIIIAIAIMVWSVLSVRKRMMLHNKIHVEVGENDEMKIVIDHREPENTSTVPNNRMLSLEIKDLNYTTADEEFLHKAITCVKAHLSDFDFDTNQFVDEMATSRTTLFKHLKKLTGMNTSRFIRDIRLKAALQMLLQDPNIRISDLAYRVGFNDPKYFSTCFKEEYGKTPKEYCEEVGAS